MRKESGSIHFYHQNIVHHTYFSALHELDLALQSFGLYADAGHYSAFVLSGGGDVADEEGYSFHIPHALGGWVESLSDKAGSDVGPLEQFGVVPEKGIADCRCILWHFSFVLKQSYSVAKAGWGQGFVCV